MLDIYKIDGTTHYVHDSNKPLLLNPNYFPDFQEKLTEFKELIIRLVNNKTGATFVHFGDGDYFFHKQQSVGSASVGKRALSVPYNQININRFINGWKACDYQCVEYLEVNAKDKMNKLYPNIVPKTIPTEFLYGLTLNKWFFKTFKGKVGLIGSNNKLNVIKELMKRKVYQDYIGLEKFNDYIIIPEKFACDNLDNTINIVKKQLELANPNTQVYLYGVGHVKSGLIHELPKIKNAVYLDVGAAIDAIAGLIEPERPYALGWCNHRLKNYNYSHIDLLQYRVNEDQNLKIIE